MNYKEALDYVHSIPKFKKPLGNANLRRLLEELGNPQDKLEFIHIAGTNGKGSAAAMISSVLTEQGYSVGLFTSPYIEVFNERIRINGENIADSELAECVGAVRAAMENSGAYVSEFAFITAVGMKYFCGRGCDYVVLEAGMGGRLDATNVIDGSVVSVITSIGLDHTEYLGSTVEEIAAEKCGIIKACGTVVSYPNETVMPVIREECKKRHAKLFEAQTAEKTEDGFVYKNKSYKLALEGEYQAQNAAVALEAVEAMRRNGVEISDEAVERGLKAVKWSARFERVRDNVIIDGAHNIDGIKALKKSLGALGKNVIIVMAMMEDKSVEECVREIAPGSRMFIATELNMPRCAKAEKLASAVSGIKADAVVETDIKQAIDLALKACGSNEIVCICGSLYLAGEAKKIFSKNGLQNK